MSEARTTRDEKENRHMEARITYSTTTPESVEHGDVAETGYYLPGGWRFETSEGVELVGENGYRLRDVVNVARDLGITNDVGCWFGSYSTICNFSTGEEVEYALHINGVTPSTYRRIARLLTGKR